MGSSTSIEWTEATWNPVTGCTKISSGCRHCYAERMAIRLQAMGQRNYINGFLPTLHEDSLDLPLGWKTPRKVFVNSMSDLFHEEVPDEFILKVFKVMSQAKQHVFQVLTKRSTRLAELNPKLIWSPNIWMGVTVEEQGCVGRLDDLRQTGARVKFVSMEPLLGPMPNLNLQDIDWVIVGGESGPGARPMCKEWVLDILSQCEKSDVLFFFKQWGGVRKKAAGRELEGRIWSEMPQVSLLAG